MTIASCTNPAAEPSTSTGPRSLTLAANNPGDSLDAAADFAGWNTNRYGITETLLTVDPQLRVIPNLATAWTNPDDTTWELTLREGVTFHNGDPVDGEAVKESLEYALSTNVRIQVQLPVDEIRADERTVTITTTEPVPALPNILTDPLTGVQALDDEIDSANAPVGTGPFRVTDFTPQESVHLEAYPDYWQGEPKLDQVTVKAYADTQAMGLALQAGEVDVVVRPDASSLPLFEDPDTYTLWQVTSTRADAVIVNTEAEAMSDIRVREAVNLALDRDGYVALMHGMGRPAYSLFPDSLAFGGTNGLTLSVTGQDLTKAKQLLVDAGYTDEGGKLMKDGKQLTLQLLTYPMRPQLTQMAQLLQSDLKGLGVAVEITELESTADAMKAGDFDLGMYSAATAPTGDPGYFMETFLSADGDSNNSHWNSPEFESALKAVNVTVDPDERYLRSRAAEQVILDEMPYLVFGYQQWWAVSTVNVTGLVLLPTEYHMLSHETHVS